MIPYMDLNEQVDADFIRARRRARLRAVVARFRREGHASNRLLSFDDIRRELVAYNRRYRGRRVVELYEIGEAYFVVDGHHRVSVARYHDVPTVEAAVAEFHPKLPAASVLPTTSNSKREA